MDVCKAKKEFLMCNSWIELFQNGTDEQAGMLIKACYDLAVNGNENITISDTTMKYLFDNLIKPYIIAKNTSYAEVYELKKEGGKKGAQERNKKRLEQKELADIDKDFEIIYQEYPRHKGKSRAKKYYKEYVTEGREVNGEIIKLDNQQILNAIHRFNEENQNDESFIPYFSTFLNNGIFDYIPGAC